MKKSKLGRGLDALLTDSRGDVAAVGETLRQLPIETLRRGKYQPRVQMDQDALDELANSIKTQGIMQPILV
ncbi:MAG: ParB N-terminal domain-containing protein, partial [Gammaproteobacteria bacterium]|nr:ParB N-terminal domain-containing protein [Gammaproteobacteria bacterium]